MKKTTFLTAVFFIFLSSFAKLSAEETNTQSEQPVLNEQKTKEREADKNAQLSDPYFKNILNYAGLTKFKNPLFNQFLLYENDRVGGVMNMAITPFMIAELHYDHLDTLSLCHLIVDEFSYAVLECQEVYSGFHTQKPLEELEPYPEKYIVTLIADRFLSTCHVTVLDSLGSDYSTFKRDLKGKDVSGRNYPYAFSKNARPAVRVPVKEYGAFCPFEDALNKEVLQKVKNRLIEALDKEK